MTEQFALFGDPPARPALPEGFRYQGEVISGEAERGAALPPDALQHVLVTEYSEGAAIGWHRDKDIFGDIVGISLLSPCTFRLRRKQGRTRERASITAEPRSAYLLRGASRTEWEHSIPGVAALRYSLTFRNLRAELAR